MLYYIICFNPCFVGLWGFEASAVLGVDMKKQVSILVLLDYGALRQSKHFLRVYVYIVSILVLLDYGALSQELQKIMSSDTEFQSLFCWIMGL